MVGMNPYFKDLTPDIVSATFEELLHEYESRHLTAQNDYE